MNTPESNTSTLPQGIFLRLSVQVFCPYRDAALIHYDAAFARLFKRLLARELEHLLSPGWEIVACPARESLLFQVPVSNSRAAMPMLRKLLTDLGILDHASLWLYSTDEAFLRPVHLSRHLPGGANISFESIQAEFAERALIVDLFRAGVKAIAENQNQNAPPAPPPES